MKLTTERVAGLINGFINPLLMCSFLPIIEGKAVLDVASVTGF